MSPKIWKEEQKQRTRRGRTEEANWDCAGFKKREREKRKIKINKKCMKKEIKEKILWMGFKFNCNFDSVVKIFQCFCFPGKRRRQKGFGAGNGVCGPHYLLNVVLLLSALPIF